MTPEELRQQKYIEMMMTGKFNPEDEAFADQNAYRDNMLAQIGQGQINVPEFIKNQNILVQPFTGNTQEGYQNWLAAKTAAQQWIAANPLTAKYMQPYISQQPVNTQSGYMPAGYIDPRFAGEAQNKINNIITQDAQNFYKDISKINSDAYYKQQAEIAANQGGINTRPIDLPAGVDQNSEDWLLAFGNQGANTYNAKALADAAAAYQKHGAPATTDSAGIDYFNRARNNRFFDDNVMSRVNAYTKNIYDQSQQNVDKYKNFLGDRAKQDDSWATSLRNARISKINSFTPKGVKIQEQQLSGTTPYYKPFNQTDQQKGAYTYDQKVNPYKAPAVATNTRNKTTNAFDESNF